jgi:flagellar protein FlaG
MTTNVTSAAAVPDPTPGASATAAAQQTAPTPASDPAATVETQSADLRLVIEDDQKAGCFVYKTINWRTGEIVQQLPREQLIKLREADYYAAGSVIKTSV